MSNILLFLQERTFLKRGLIFVVGSLLSLGLLSTPSFAQGPFGENPPTEFNAQINPVDPNWQFNPQDSATLREAQAQRLNQDGFNWWWLAVPLALLPIFYLATRYFVNNLEEDRKISPRMRSAISYHDIREARRKRVKSKKDNLKERKYDKSFAP